MPKEHDSSNHCCGAWVGISEDKYARLASSGQRFDSSLQSRNDSNTHHHWYYDAWCQARSNTCVPFSGEYHPTENQQITRNPWALLKTNATQGAPVTTFGSEARVCFVFFLPSVPQSESRSPRNKSTDNNNEQQRATTTTIKNCLAMVPPKKVGSK